MDFTLRSARHVLIARWQVGSPSVPLLPPGDHWANLVRWFQGAGDNFEATQN